MQYLKGYNGQLVSRETLDKYMSKIHPLVKPRFWALIDLCDGEVGVGESFRNDDAIEAEFIKRHVIDPQGAISWNGVRWSLKAGYAPLAPPGRTYHGAVLDGYCFAADLVGNLARAEVNAARCGLRSFLHVGAKPEPWHFQPIEIPTSRAGYTPSLFPLSDWDTVTPPKPYSNGSENEDDMLIVVNMIADDVDPNRRWVWNGVSADRLWSEAEFNTLKILSYRFHPNWDELSKPYGMTKAQLIRYGAEV